MVVTHFRYFLLILDLLGNTLFASSLKKNFVLYKDVLRKQRLCKLDVSFENSFESASKV